MLSDNTAAGRAAALLEFAAPMVRAVRATQVEIETAVQALRDGALDPSIRIIPVAGN